MAVSIDASEVRRGPAPVKADPSARVRLPLRAILIGGLGGAGLLAFSVGAFSFFSGLADPRVRHPRPLPPAASMPDLRDGVPALSAQAPAAEAIRLNLPPASAGASAVPGASPVEPVPPGALPPAPTAGPGEEGAPHLRAAMTSEVQGEAAHAGPAPAGAAGSASARRPGLPPIQNAAIVAETRTAIAIPPGRAETVRARIGQTSAFVSLQPEPAPEARPTPRSEPKTDTRPSRASEALPPSPKPAAVRQTASKASPRPAAQAHAAPASEPAEPATAAPADESEVLGVPIPGGQHLKAGIKALGGMFGGE